MLVGLGKLDFGIYGGGIWSILFELLGFWHHDNVGPCREEIVVDIHHGGFFVSFSGLLWLRKLTSLIGLIQMLGCLCALRTSPSS